MFGRFSGALSDAGIGEGAIDIIYRIIITLVVLLAGYIFIRLLCRIVRKALEKSRMDQVLHTFVINCIRVLFWILIVITILGGWGLPVSAFVTALGAAGVAVAQALRDSLSNFAGGILILLTQPFKKNDYIEDFQTAGRVEKIDLLYTTLLTLDNKVVTMPNGKLANSTIVNYSAKEFRRVDCVFSVSDRDDIERVKDILHAVTESNPDILEKPAPCIGVANQGDGKIDWDVMVWCKTSNYWDVKYFLQEQVKMAFSEANIQMAYPKMEVRLKK